MDEPLAGPSRRGIKRGRLTRSSATQGLARRPCPTPRLARWLDPASFARQRCRLSPNSVLGYQDAALCWARAQGDGEMTETVITSDKKKVVIGFDHRFVMIGERINPTGR